MTVNVQQLPPVDGPDPLGLSSLRTIEVLDPKAGDPFLLAEADYEPLTLYADVGDGEDGKVTLRIRVGLAVLITATSTMSPLASIAPSLHVAALFSGPIADALVFVESTLRNELPGFDERGRCVVASSDPAAKETFDRLNAYFETKHLNRLGHKPH